MKLRSMFQITIYTMYVGTYVLQLYIHGIKDTSYVLEGIMQSNLNKNVNPGFIIIIAVLRNFYFKNINI